MLFIPENIGNGLQGQNQAQTFRRERVCRQNRKCSCYAILLKNGVSYMRVYMRSSHQTISPLEEFGVRLSLFSQYVPGTSESKYSRKGYRNSIIFKA